MSKPCINCINFFLCFYNDTLYEILISNMSVFVELVSEMF